MTRWREILSDIRESRSTRRYLIAFLLLAGIVWFIPPVWRLKSDSIEVTRWVKSKGKITAMVGPKEKGWTAYNRISRHTINAVISAEDGKFYQHHGLDLDSIAESAKENYKKGRYVRGGSTITQQLVKMAFLSRDKTILRKAREAVGALLIELVLDKRHILEWYLNMVEFGDGIYGLDAAARIYFGSKPEMLTASQSINLALVLPSPNRWSAGLRARSLTPFGQRRFAAIVSNMYRSGYITKEQWITTLAGGNFGSPISGYQSVIAQYESETSAPISDPRNVEPQKGEPEGDVNVEADEMPEEPAAGPDLKSPERLDTIAPATTIASPEAIELPPPAETTDTSSTPALEEEPTTTIPQPEATQ